MWLSSLSVAHSDSMEVMVGGGGSHIKCTIHGGEGQVGGGGGVGGGYGGVGSHILQHNTLNTLK